MQSRFPVKLNYRYLLRKVNPTSTKMVIGSSNIHPGCNKP